MLEINHLRKNFNNQTQHGRRSASTLAKNDDKSVSGTDSSAVSSALAKKRSVFNMRSTIGGRFNLAPTNRLLLGTNNSREDKLEKVPLGFHPFHA